MDIVIMVGTWDFWPNYHYIQYITKLIVTTLIYDCIHCQYIYFHKNNQIFY